MLASTQRREVSVKAVESELPQTNQLVKIMWAPALMMPTRLLGVPLVTTKAAVRKWLVAENDALH